MLHGLMQTLVGLNWDCSRSRMFMMKATFGHAWHVQGCLGRAPQPHAESTATRAVRKSAAWPRTGAEGTAYHSGSGAGPDLRVGKSQR